MSHHDLKSALKIIKEIALLSSQGAEPKILTDGVQGKVSWSGGARGDWGNRKKREGEGGNKDWMDGAGGEGEGGEGAC